MTFQEKHFRIYLVLFLAVAGGIARAGSRADCGRHARAARCATQAVRRSAAPL